MVHLPTPGKSARILRKKQASPHLQRDAAVHGLAVPAEPGSPGPLGIVLTSEFVHRIPQHVGGEQRAAGVGRFLESHVLGRPERVAVPEHPPAGALDHLAALVVAAQPVGANDSHPQVNPVIALRQIADAALIEIGDRGNPPTTAAAAAGVAVQWPMPHHAPTAAVPVLRPWRP